MNQTLPYELLLPKEKVNYIVAHIVTICFLLLSAGFFFLSFLHRNYDKQLQESIASEVLRFHVVANSDSDIDQEVKMLIKNQLTTTLSPLLKDAKDLSTAKQIINKNLTTLEQIANETLESKGFLYQATASIEKGYFPLKVYGDLSLPPGEYEAIRIELGSATGQNWWCVMFPPLCFIDSTYSVVPEQSKEELREVLTKEEFDYIFKDNTKDSKIKVVIRFKFLEKLFQK